VLRDIDLSRPANGDHGRWDRAVPLQRLEILEQLAIHPLKQGEKLFFESLQLLLDSEPFELHVVLF
jgi:hypothetical protein